MPAAKYGYTMVHIKLETHKKLKDYSKMNGMKMGTVLDDAIEQYISSQSEYEVHKAQALGKTKLFEEMYAYIQKISKDEGTN
jgi:hypothetical protein